MFLSCFLLRGGVFVVRLVYVCYSFVLCIVVFFLVSCVTIIIGIPSSLLAANISDAFDKRYYWFYTEKWADSIMGIRDSRDRLTVSGRPRRQVDWWKAKSERNK